MKGFGQPQLAMILPLDGRKKLVNADIEKVKQALTEQGYYLQLPPPPEDLLKQHLSVMGAENTRHEQITDIRRWHYLCRRGFSYPR